MNPTTTSLWLLSPLIFSCAAAPSSARGFEAPPEAVRGAVRECLKDHPEVREDGDRFVTGWGPERTDLDSGEQGVVLGHGYRIRVRHDVTVRGSVVDVRSKAERRAPGGVRSIRWERVDPAPVEREFLEAVARRLEEKR